MTSEIIKLDQELEEKHTEGGLSGEAGAKIIGFLAAYTY